MKFCVITPIGGLRKFAMLSNTHLVLAHINSPEYREFYRARRESGDTLILDNGAYEAGESISPKELEDSISYYSPQWVVCPDKLFSHWQVTYEMTKDFLDRYASNNYQVKFMAIPQTVKGDIFGWTEGLLRMCDELKIDGIGLPRALITHYAKERPTIRAEACSFIKSRYPHLYIHAMGMANGDPWELPLLDAVGCDSVDSSAPVWRAWSQGLSLGTRDRTLWDTYGTECDFWDSGEGLSARNIDQIYSNLEVCGVKCPTQPK